MKRQQDMSLLDLHDALLFDLDGTLMHGSQPIPHAAEAVETARKAGRAVVFATNNASRTPQQAADHLAVVGIEAQAEEFVTSPQVASRLLADRLDPGAKVLVVGGPSLAAQIQEVGLAPVDVDSEDVVAVVQGWTPDLGWKQLAEGAYAIRHGALWMATNVDATLPTERGLAPGNGSMVAALRHATGVEPAVAGKPEPGMFEVAAREHSARRPLIIGDRLDTDIEGAVRAGMDSLLVLTGVDDTEAALRAEPVRRPTYILPDLAEIAAPFPLPVVDGDRSRCGAVSATWTEGDIVVNGEPDDPRVLRAALALLRVHSAESAWTGQLRDERVAVASSAAR
ncbi:haloacid dehalogenase [Brachybacterium ginsengisoli]|uniref:Haloacid dehalogenase n=1 Tax=Brachybacterium ginsengisoli TaxID=1331682 RepID=A0A291GXX9_9MICO|nr:HAD-IIA family hydrolase [Brachybacterium ginsengisoli]ATG55079.1 haloacid dehalogenase [Brachybacterium ginsengisoli]